MMQAIVFDISIELPESDIQNYTNTSKLYHYEHGYHSIKVGSVVLHEPRTRALQ